MSLDNMPGFLSAASLSPSPTGCGKRRAHYQDPKKKKKKLRSAEAAAAG
jgi:hypothetical protein